MIVYFWLFCYLGIGSAPTKAPNPAPYTSSSSGGGRRNSRSGSSTNRKSSPSNPAKTKKHEVVHFNSEIEIKVKSLSLILNKPDYEVASASVMNYSSKLSLRDGNFAIAGRLGSFSLKVSLNSLKPLTSNFHSKLWLEFKIKILPFFFRKMRICHKICPKYSLKYSQLSVSFFLFLSPWISGPVYDVWRAVQGPFSIPKRPSPHLPPVSPRHPRRESDPQTPRHHLQAPNVFNHLRPHSQVLL